MTDAELIAVQNRTIWTAHRKVGEVSRIVESFWAHKNAANPYDRETAWAMHVALVQLAEVLKR